MLGRLFGRGESRDMTYQQLWLRDEWPSNESWSGAHVDQLTALTIDTVYACVRIYTDTVSTLPVAPYYRSNGERKPWGPRPIWLDDPGVDGLSWTDYVQQGMVSLLLDGNWFTRIYRNTRGEVVALKVLNPLKVEVRRDGSGDVEYWWDTTTRIPARDILHITELRLPGDLRGVSRIAQLKQTLGLSRALDEFSSRFFSGGSVSSGIITTPAMVNADQAKEIKRAFEEGHKGLGKSHRVGVLGGGSQWVKTGVDPDEAQMLESKRFSVESIAKVFSVPLHMLQVATPGAMSYASVEQNAIQWVTQSLRPYVHKVEMAHTKLLPQGVFIRMNMDALLRGDTASRYSAYSQALQSGWASINDVRRLEDMAPVDGGDVTRVPLANVDLPAANIVETEKNVAMAVQLITAGADPEETLKAFGLPVIPWTESPASAPDPGSPQDMPMTDPGATNGS